MDGIIIFGCIGVGLVLGIYISSQIKEHIRSRINNKELIDNLNGKETYPEFVKKHYQLDKDKIRNKNMTIKDISHYYTYIKKKKDDN
jgi:hypothetical protein